MVLGFERVGGVRAFLETNADKLHTILPADHPEIPWTALLLGIWIPNMFYWGCNQFITQRTLGARALRAGQRGIMFAALFGAVMSSLDSMLNSASTIFTMDLYRRRFRPDADAQHYVRVGRIATGVLVIAACLLGGPVYGVLLWALRERRHFGSSGRATSASHPTRGRVRWGSVYSSQRWRSTWSSVEGGVEGGGRSCRNLGR